MLWMCITPHALNPNFSLSCDVMMLTRKALLETFKAVATASTANTKPITTIWRHHGLSVGPPTRAYSVRVALG